MNALAEKIHIESTHSKVWEKMKEDFKTKINYDEQKKYIQKEYEKLPEDVRKRLNPFSPLAASFLDWS